MTVLQHAFIPGTGSGNPLPLARFLPPLPAGMVSACLRQAIPPGSWVLDPIASTPTLALETAREGYRVLVVSNNPILSFMLEVLALAPTPGDLNSAISELAASRRGDERLELHFQALYQTECPKCFKRIQVKALIWRKDESAPLKRELICPYCKTEGEFPLAPFDHERLILPGNPNLHLARALERICAQTDEVREGTVEALHTYLPRSLYFCTTLINKIEGMPLAPEHKQWLLALALSVCDRANSLWTHPSGRNRPRQLSTPPEFREDNLWAAFEEAVPDWSSQPARVPLVKWPHLPPESGGICLFQGRLKNLLPLPAAIELNHSLVVLPRPNQAFWTLSAVWAGWLWGRDAVQPLKSALERRRYDWQWHTTALHNTFSTLSKHVTPAFQLVGLMPELVPGFLAAAVIAAQASGFELTQTALSIEPEFAQIYWKPSSRSAATSISAPHRIIQEAAVQHLQQRNEPSTYLPVYTSGLSALAENQLLPAQQSQLSFDTLSRIQAMFSAAFSDQSIFKRFDSRVKNIESGWWWLQQPPSSTSMPLSDRIEMEIVRYLLKHQPCRQNELEAALAQQFPGLLTPPGELVLECLNSYAELEASPGTAWQLRQAEQPASRRNDLHAVQIGLIRLGKRLGFQAEGEAPVVWRAASGETILSLYPVVSGIISRAVLEPSSSPKQSVLVIPGSRARLIAYKLQHDPRLIELISSGWRFLKFRLLRELLTRADLDEHLFQELLNSDPPTLEEATQMRFF